MHMLSNQTLYTEHQNIYNLPETRVYVYIKYTRCTCSLYIECVHMYVYFSFSFYGEFSIISDLGVRWQNGTGISLLLQRPCSRHVLKTVSNWPGSEWVSSHAVGESKVVRHHVCHLNTYVSWAAETGTPMLHQAQTDFLP